MKRLPIIATILVLAAVGTMIALGIWQLGRAEYKDQRIITLQERVQLPLATYPYDSPTDESFLYRSLAADCSEVLGWQALGGQDVNNRNGWRQIATCRHGPSGVEFKVDKGIGGTPAYDTEWSGGPVTGRAIFEPDDRGLLALITRQPRESRLMIIADTPVEGLFASRQPDPSEEKNSSWAYAGQWFFFALTALAIYGFAVQARMRRRR